MRLQEYVVSRDDLNIQALLAGRYARSLTQVHTDRSQWIDTVGARTRSLAHPNFSTLAASRQETSFTTQCSLFVSILHLGKALPPPPSSSRFVFNEHTRHLATDLDRAERTSSDPAQDT